MIAQIVRSSRRLGAFGLLLLLAGAAQALPSYARQTGQDCVACHLSFPELTPYGRMFKLNGYTFGEHKTLPLAVMAVGSVTRVANTQGNDAAYPKRNDPVLEGGSLFIAGGLGSHAGMFSQWTYNNLNPVTDANGNFVRFGGQTTVDNNDWRIADRLTQDEYDLIVGMSLNNNPTVQDVWNSTPAFSYPFQTSRLAGVWGIGAPTTLIEGGLAQQVAGYSAYAMLNKHWYGEFGAYRAADGLFKVLSHGINIGNRLQGNNPYWRFAYNQEWGSNSVEVGTFGMNAHVQVDPADPSAGLNHYRDVGLDVQYQHLLDPHVWSAQAYYVRETVDWNAALVGNSVANSQSTLRAFHLKGTYWYNRTWGATLSYFNERGSTDYLAYPQNGVPDTNGFTGELNYMIRQNWRVGLQYTDFQKYRGASSNYDGNGRNARDNNITYLYTWFAY